TASNSKVFLNASGKAYSRHRRGRLPPVPSLCAADRPTSAGHLSRQILFPRAGGSKVRSPTQKILIFSPRQSPFPALLTGLKLRVDPPRRHFSALCRGG